MLTKLDELKNRGLSQACHVIEQACKSRTATVLLVVGPTVSQLGRRETSRFRAYVNCRLDQSPTSQSLSGRDEFGAEYVSHTQYRLQRSIFRWDFSNCATRWRSDRSSRYCSAMSCFPALLGLFSFRDLTLVLGALGDFILVPEGEGPQLVQGPQPHFARMSSDYRINRTTCNGTRSLT